MTRAARWMWFIVEQAALAAFLCMLVLVGAQIFFRYVLQVSVPWTEEAARWFYAYQIFLGCAIAARENVHLRATFLLDRFPARMKAAIECCIAGAGMIFVGGIIWGGAVMIWATSTVEAGSFALSMSYLYVSIPVSFAIIFAVTAKDFARHWQAVRRNTAPEDIG